MTLSALARFDRWTKQFVLISFRDMGCARMTKSDVNQ